MSGIEHRYTVDVMWKGREESQVRAEGRPAIEFGPPPEFGGGNTRWSPEHMIVASISTCFMLTFMSLAEKTKLSVQVHKCPVEGVLTQGEDRRWSFTQFFVRPELNVPKEEQEKARTLLEKAEKYCLISQSVKGHVAVEPVFA